MSDLIVLNRDGSGSNPGGSSSIIEQLNRLMLELKSNFITEDGIDYAGIKKSPLYGEYKELAGSLRSFNATALPPLTRKTFFINLYNVQTLHVLAEQADLPESPMKTNGMWNKYAYDIGGLVLTLDDVEHGVLRCNKGHPASGKPQFGDGDKRSELSLTELDYRIHYALNCGAKSCPPIRIYQEAKLDQQLTLAAKSFCSQEVTLDPDHTQDGKRKLHLSKLMLWYKGDFGASDSEVVQTLAGFTQDEVMAKEMLENAENIELVFKDYDWKINKN